MLHRSARVSSIFWRSVFYLIPTLLILSKPNSLLKAQEPSSEVTEIVISPNRSPRAINKVASSITVITAEEMDRKKQRTVIEALSATPGVQVVQSGGFGGNVSIFLRGANAEHTLVIVDGIEVNDPVSTARLPSIANMTLDNIERIEILRGPQSVLYGSDALGGVINIITKKGAGAPNGSVNIEGGSYNTFTEKASLNGESDDLHYAIAASRIDSDSISQANARQGNQEHDAYDNTSFAGRLDYDLDDETLLSAIFRTHLSHTDLDNFGGAGGDDPNRFFGQKQFFSRFQGEFSGLAQGLTQTLGVSYSDQRFSDTNSPDFANPLDAADGQFESDTVKLDLLNTIDLNPVTVSFGLETENERAASDYLSISSFGEFHDDLPSKENRTNAAFLQTDVDWLERFSTTAGVRVDDAQFLDPQLTWRAGQNVRLAETDTVLRASVGTGFKVPSLFQRFSQYGREDLLAEKSLGVDAGVDQSFFSGDLVLSGTYFRNNFKNLITFDSGTFLYQNVADARTDGLEFSSTVKLPWRSEVVTSYTYLCPQDKTTGEDLLRRARHKVGFDLRSQLSDTLQASVSGYYLGQRLDNDFGSFPASQRNLGGYTLANLALNYKPSRTIELYTKIENIFDREYESVIGFGAPGAAAYGGLVYHY